MSYNRRILLKKIIEIQNIVIKEKKRGGISQKWIFKNLIANRYFISIATFNNYLARNAKKELKELEASQ